MGWKCFSQVALIPDKIHFDNTYGCKETIKRTFVGQSFYKNDLSP